MAAYNDYNFLSKTFEKLNNALNSFAQNFSASIATEIAPLVAGGLTLTLIIMGIMAVYGMLDRPFKEVAWKMMWASVIMSMALTSALYQTYIIDVFLTLPDELVTSIIAGSIADSNVHTGDGAAKAIEQVLGMGIYKAGQYFNEGSVGIIGETNLAPYLYGILLLIGTLLCVLMGALWLFIAKVVLALMLGVGPIFICCLIWQSTRQYFWSWVGQILNTIITTIFVLAIFSIFATIFQTNLENLQISQESQGFMDAAAYTFLGILCMGVLLQIPQYVSQLTGAAGGAVGSAMGRIAAAAGGGAIAGAALGKASIRSGFAGTSAGKAFTQSYKQSRAGGGGRLSSGVKAARGARHEFNKSNQEMKQGYPDYFRKPPSQHGSNVQGTGGYSYSGGKKTPPPTKSTKGISPPKGIVIKNNGNGNGKYSKK